jgi:cysteinyl-tRNA synthetase
VRYWLHTAMVRHEGEKMSKSLGNLVMVRDLLESWSPDALRIYLAQHHYREAWEHNLDALRRAERLAQKLREAVSADRGADKSLDPSSARAAFVEAMDDDLDTPSALDHLERLAEEILDTAHAGRDMQQAQEVLRSMGRVFGLRLDAEGPEERVTAEWNRYLENFVS